MTKMKKINWKYEPNKDSTLSSSAPVLLFEKRVLSVVTLSIILGLITWLIAVSTDYWFITVYYNHTDLLWTHSGLWKKCDIDVNFVKTCEYLSQNVIMASSFIIVAIVLLLISLSCGFSVYSLLVFISSYFLSKYHVIGESMVPKTWKNSGTLYCQNTMIFIVDDIWRLKSAFQLAIWSLLCPNGFHFLCHPTFKNLFETTQHKLLG